MDAQDLAKFLVGHNFYEAFVTAQNARLAVRGEGKLSDFHGMSLRARLGLGEPDAPDSWLSVRASGNPIAVDRLGRLAGHVRHRDHAFHGGDMGELRRSGDNIADRINACLASALKFIYLDEFTIE